MKNQGEGTTRQTYLTKKWREKKQMVGSMWHTKDEVCHRTGVFQFFLYIYIQSLLFDKSFEISTFGSH